MKYFKSILVLVVAAVAFAFTVPSDGGYKVGDTIEDFKLKNIDDKMVSLSDYSEAKGFIIIFTCSQKGRMMVPFQTSF